MPNRLANETSPYLLQHADNPVDWYPWGEEALEKARREDRPIFLSIGYAACHWCHVMAHESFEDPQTAAILNEHFVSIKVDREERPDLDDIYMQAVQALTGGGGWPMSVFLTPDGRPFFGGTYFPPEPRYGMPAFRDILLAVADAWRHRRAALLDGSARLTEALQPPNLQPETLQPETLLPAIQSLARDFDPHHGGWGGAPKFPQPMTLEFLLRYHHVTGDAQALSMAVRSLESMARGGIYDQLGGGFHRYSVDDRWLVPHFEKMLYDNAQLARVYLHAWQVTQTPLFRDVAQETLDYVLREMTDPAGGFYATQDADSEGEEGKFFLWTPAEVRQVLGEEADRFMAAYGVTGQGNFEGRNILTFVGPLEERKDWAQARERLFSVRQHRVPPGRDDKVLTSWNGLMLAALAEAARTLRQDDYHVAAVRAADFLLHHLRRADGRLWHVWRDGQARINGYLEDYADLMEGLLELYQTTFEPRWFVAAQELAEVVLARFSAPDGGFFDTSDDHESLIVRPRQLQDNATPSGGAMAATALLRLAGLAAEPRFAEAARAALSSMQPLLSRYPLGFSQWLIALQYDQGRPREVAIVGDLQDDRTRALLDAYLSGYRPHQVVAVGTEGEGVPLLRGRHLVDGRPAAYVCVDGTCRPPVTEPV